MASRELAALIHLLTSRPIPENPTVADRRQGFDMLAAKLPVAPDIACEQVDAAGVPAEWVVAPGAAASRVLLYLHGGGYVVGSLNTHRDLAGRLSRAAAAGWSASAEQLGESRTTVADVPIHGPRHERPIVGTLRLNSYDVGPPAQESACIRCPRIDG